MKAILLGKRKVAFTADDGREISGTTVYLGFDDDNDVEGMVCQKEYISDSVAIYKDLTVGKELEVTYNRKGKISSIA